MKLLSILPEHTKDILGKPAADQIVAVLAVLSEASDDGRLVECWARNGGEYGEDSAYALAAHALAQLPKRAQSKLLMRLYRNFIKADDG